jgi:Ca2+-binding RTX toxin-like protein
VWAGTRPRRELVDRDRDVIDGGPAGRRYGDYVISGEPGQPNPDEVRLAGGTSGDGGSAGTVELLGTPTAQTFLDGTRGSELTLETTDVNRVSIDTTAGTYTRDGATGALTGFTDFLLTNRGETRYIDFRGSDADETLLMDTTRNSAYDVRMGGGDDVIALQTDRIHRRVNVFDGGGGRDQLGIAILRKEVRLDLRRGRLLAGKQRNAVPAEATRFEDAEVVAGLVELTGTTGDNDLRANACRTRVDALAGDDRVSSVTTLNYLGYFSCKAQRDHFEGGGGDDLLVGDGGADVLLGGPGRDRANGGSGRDVCSAERTRWCEVRR